VSNVDEQVRQALRLAHKVGVMTDAYRRWTETQNGHNRFFAALADVAAEAHATANTLNVALRARTVRFTHLEPMPATAWPSVLAVFAAASVYINHWTEYEPIGQGVLLEELIYRACCVASILGFDQGYFESCIQRNMARNAMSNGVVTP
jgi:hypothetical protein